MSPTVLVVCKLLVIVVGLLGVLGHWAVRWYSHRTTSTFGEYLKNNVSSTYASLSANVASGIGIAAMIAPNLNFEQILGYIGLAYTQGFMWDSKLNKDSGTATIEVDNEKSLDNLLSDDSKL